MGVCAQIMVSVLSSDSQSCFCCQPPLPQLKGSGCYNSLGNVKEMCKQYMLLYLCGTLGPVFRSSGAGCSSLPRIPARSHFPYPSCAESGVLCLGC